MHGGGTVFQLIPGSGGTWTENILYNFAGGNDGSNPIAGLTMDSSGNLYGATSGGGALGYGTVFQLTPKSNGRWTETVLYSFTNQKDGSYPITGVTLDQQGNIYGTTLEGGSSNCGQGCGAVYKLQRQTGGGWNFVLLHDFYNHPGGYPTGTLIFDSAGTLYGTTEGDYSVTFGSVFEITP